MDPSVTTTMTPFLQKLESRSPFGEDEREAILRLPFVPRQVAANQDFVRQGEHVTHSCFVLEGVVGTFGQNRHGTRQITSLFMSGDMIDLNTVVVPRAMSALQALITSTILQVPHTALRDVAGRYPRIAEAFWRECVVDASLLHEWVVNVGRRDARSRMAHLLCEIACRKSQTVPENNVPLPFPITQTQLAEMLGLTAVHVNRTMKGLREDGLVEFSGRVMRILDWDGLATVGEFDPGYLQMGLAQCEPGNGPAAADRKQTAI